LIWNGHHDLSRVQGELTAGLPNLNVLSSILAELMVCNLYKAKHYRYILCAQVHVLSELHEEQANGCMFTNPSSQVPQGAVTFTGKLQVEGLQSSSCET
jgi:hypothetical protein